MCRYYTCRPSLQLSGTSLYDFSMSLRSLYRKFKITAWFISSWIPNPILWPNVPIFAARTRACRQPYNAIQSLSTRSPPSYPVSIPYILPKCSTGVLTTYVLSESPSPSNRQPHHMHTRTRPSSKSYYYPRCSQVAGELPMSAGQYLALGSDRLRCVLHTPSC